MSGGHPPLTTDRRLGAGPAVRSGSAAPYRALQVIDGEPPRDSRFRLSCFGNHEALDQGVAAMTEGLAEALIGTRKPLALPEDFDHDRALELFTERPETFMAGPAVTVTADPRRRAITRQEFVQAHFRPGSRPFGHGFSEQNRAGRRDPARCRRRPGATAPVPQRRAVAERSHARQHRAGTPRP